MTEKLSFYRDQWNAPAFRPHDEAYSALGSMLTSDVQNSEILCLDRLAWIEDVRSGRKAEQGWQGNSWDAKATPQGLQLYDLYSDDWEGHYSLEEAHDVLVGYLRFLSPGMGPGSGPVTEWEKEYGRPHPCRDHLG
ncbi:hypothetical protein [Actinomadura rugatobispora]|uniref:Uncharacterized protein n=1 Tax=Actinomadura rugatobispora TaxID=1994 RepID=A0ABW0ZYK5_9ACTN|nr:hypothetical protein GCM10010200_050420 [Actinomadura rugatobispora]